MTKKHKSKLKLRSRPVKSIKRKSTGKFNFSKKKKPVKKKVASRRIKKEKVAILPPVLPTSSVPSTSLPVKEKKVKVPSAASMYFTQDTENAIILYNSEEDQEKRNTIYNEKIKHSFEKLVENIFNKFKFTYFETSSIEVQRETIAHLVANISKFQAGKGKAYSYFSIIAKHYLIFHNNNNYKRFKQNVDISDTPSETTVCLQVEDSYYKNTEMNDFMRMMIEYWDLNVSKIFTKQKDLNIANAVIELFRNGDRIDAFNKKALYLYIREISSCKTQQITKVINRMKQYQSIITKNYINLGVLHKNPYKK